ncbi:MAG: hypothetical protein EBX65_02015, partial [Betaproteobacteria bacterium]|nr:hypothetical protein [Betaproteobacteria bacterium]
QSSESPSPGSEAVVSRVFRLRYELANNILPIIRPLVPPNNTISAMASNNSLVVTDYASNLERIAQLIEELDAPSCDGCPPPMAMPWPPSPAAVAWPLAPKPATPACKPACAPMPCAGANPLAPPGD